MSIEKQMNWMHRRGQAKKLRQMRHIPLHPSTFLGDVALRSAYSYLGPQGTLFWKNILADFERNKMKRNRVSRLTSSEIKAEDSHVFTFTLTVALFLYPITSSNVFMANRLLLVTEKDDQGNVCLRQYFTSSNWSPLPPLSFLRLTANRLFTRI